MTRMFDPNIQNEDTSSKIIAGLERISEAFKVLLWEKAKEVQLSPIQIQLLIFIAYHEESLCTVSHLAREFNLTKATISDAIRVIHNKALIKKAPSSEDSRSYSISLTTKGKKIVSETEDFPLPIKRHLDALSNKAQETLFATISRLIHQLNQTGVLTVQRTCFSCKYYDTSKKTDYCHLLQKPLTSQTIRRDCPEFESKE